MAKNMKQATFREFSAVRNYPGVEIRFLPSRRSMTILLTYCGKTVGEQTKIYHRANSTRLASVDTMVDAEMLEYIRLPELVVA